MRTCSVNKLVESILSPDLPCYQHLSKRAILPIRITQSLRQTIILPLNPSPIPSKISVIYNHLAYFINLFVNTHYSHSNQTIQGIKKAPVRTNSDRSLNLVYFIWKRITICSVNQNVRTVSHSRAATPTRMRTG